MTTMQHRVESFNEYKRGLGYAWRTEGFLLRSFAKHADRHAPGRPITVALALDWAIAPQTTRLYHAKRLDAVRTFAKHEAARDPKTEIPPPRLLGPSYSRTTPYIYSRTEVSTLVSTATSTLPERGLRNATCSTAIGLLACTGMRVGELLALDDEDVDLSQALIHIRDSKNARLRVIPISQSAVRRLVNYKDLRERNFRSAGACRGFIRGSNGMRMSYDSFRGAFGRVLSASGVGRRQASRATPRIHDLRHTFACNHLLRAYRKGWDVDASVHDLSVYLGHANLKSTYWYLTAIPELFSECLRRLGAVGRPGES